MGKRTCEFCNGRHPDVWTEAAVKQHLYLMLEYAGADLGVEDVEDEDFLEYAGEKLYDLGVPEPLIAKFCGE